MNEERDDAKDTNEDWDDVLRKLMIEACSHPQGSPRRKQILTKVVEIVQQLNILPRRCSPCYDVAINKTWLYIFENPEKFKPSGSFIGWIKRTFHFRLIDEQNSRPQSASDYDLMNLPAKGTPGILIERFIQWVQEDPDGVLISTHVRGRPDINAQFVINERLLKGTPGEEIVETFNVPRSTLSNFFEKKCKPLIDGFNANQGSL